MGLALQSRIMNRLDGYCAYFFPERRIFLKSDEDTRYIRLRPASQAFIFASLNVFLAWSIVATSILLMDSIGTGNFREQAKRDQITYQERLREMEIERDERRLDAASAQIKFSKALNEVSEIQVDLISAEVRFQELTSAFEKLKTDHAQAERQKRRLQEQLAALSALGDTSGLDARVITQSETNADALSFLEDALRETASERDELAQAVEKANQNLKEMTTDLQLMEERNEQVFRSIEEALVVSVKPIEKIFSSVGLNASSLISTVRQGYAGYGGPSLVAPDDRADLTYEEQRAHDILATLADLNLYRIALEKVPLAHPLKRSHRFTSGFGRRWGRMHNGADFAAPHGTPIHATADGVVIEAGWSSGYGRLIKIRHEFGFETRYAHLSKIRVKKGQKVSHGQHIGDMGNTGRSTGTHLHYEVRLKKKPMNPMNYIKAAKNVF